VDIAKLILDHIEKHAHPLSKKVPFIG
jgi:hypothetical protein